MRKLLFLALTIIFSACNQGTMDLDELTEPDASMTASTDLYSLTVTGATYSAGFIMANRQTECEITMRRNYGSSPGEKLTISLSQTGFTEGYLFTYTPTHMPGIAYTNGSPDIIIPYSGYTIPYDDTSFFKLKFSNNVQGSGSGQIKLTTSTGMSQIIQVYILL